MLLSALTGAPDAEASIKSFFYEKTRELMQSASCCCVGTSTHTVDIVRDVLKVVPIYWVCDMVRTPCSGRTSWRVQHALQTGIRLKTTANGEGDYTPAELFDILADTYS